MKTVLNNAYWKELMEQIPAWVLFFRLDEKENAELVFCSTKVKDYLDWTASEFIQRSLVDSSFQKKLDGMIEKVASLSKNVIQESDCVVDFISSLGKPMQFQFTSKLFRIPSSKAYHIAILLNPVKADENQENVHFNQNGGQVLTTVSELMKNLLMRLASAVDTKDFILIHGEPKTGKTRLLEYCAQFFDSKSWNCLWLTADKMDNEEQLKRLELDRPTLIFVDDFQKISAMLRKDLSLIQRKANQTKIPFKLIMGSSESGELMLEREKLTPEVYYSSSFQQIAVPPLKLRREDVRALLNQKLVQLKKIIGVNDLDYSKECNRFIETFKWPNNFSSLQEFIVESLSYINDNQIELPDRYRLEDSEQVSLFDEDQDLGIKSFDQMVKDYLKQVLSHTGGRVYGGRGAAHVMKLAPTTLQSKLKRYGLR